MFLSSLEHETTNVARPDVYLVPSSGGAPRRLFERFWDQVGASTTSTGTPTAARVSFTGVYANVSGFFTVPLNEGIPWSNPPSRKPSPNGSRSAMPTMPHQTACGCTSFVGARQGLVCFSPGS